MAISAAARPPARAAPRAQDAAGPSWVGRPLARIEDARLVAGAGCFVADLKLPGCLHLAFVRSTQARARLGAVRTGAALRAPGVAAVLTAADLAGLGAPAVNRIVPDLRVPPFAVLAAGEVRAVGQALAAVVAQTPEQARDAAELVEAEEEALDLAPGGESFAERFAAGDAEAAFRAAHASVRVAVRHARVAPSALEPRASAASWSAQTQMLTAWLGTQTPHRARSDLADILGLPPERVRVVAPDVGGAFGGKASLYPEDIVVAFAALRLGRPVKWIATRGEDLLAATHGRGQTTEGELALDADGRVLALRARVTAPLGHWLPFSAAVPARNAARVLPGPYRVAAVEIATSGRLANTAAVGIYRGAGRPEAAMLMERLMDAAARALDLDPAEIRRRNLVPAASMPWRTPTGQVLDSGDYAGLLDAALARAGYAELRAAQARRRAQGELAGIGLALYVEPCGHGWESGRVTVARDGAVTVATGTSAQGQGRETAFAQIAADILKVAPSGVKVVHGDTQTTPAGVGALASRSTAIGGGALVRAAEAVVEKARAVAARLMQADPAAVDLTPGGFAVRGGAGRRVGWQAVAEAAGGFDESRVFETPGEAWASGCCVAAVTIDADTGTLVVERLVWIDDAGTVVNPLLAGGQLVGGAAQGLGEALMERIVYDGSGQLLTGSLMDYALPRAADMPPIEIESRATPSPLNPLGAKGVGEAGCIGVPAAIVNAAVDALSPLGIRHLNMPLTSERIWRAIRAAREGR